MAFISSDTKLNIIFSFHFLLWLKRDTLLFDYGNTFIKCTYVVKGVRLDMKKDYVYKSGKCLRTPFLKVEQNKMKFSSAA